MSSPRDRSSGKPTTSRAPKRVARPTMNDVAKASGASLKTVSRVVNGEPGVRPELIEKVNRAVKKLNYRHNQTAGSLRRIGGRTRTIGLLLEDISNPFSASLHRSIEDYARERNVEIFAGSLDGDPDREASLIQALTTRRVDGLIIVPSSQDHKYLEIERRTGIHFVFVDRPAENFEADTVIATNREGTRAAVQTLIENGHKRIAYLGDFKSIYTAEERYQGFVAAMKAAKLPIDKSLVHLGFRKRDEIAVKVLTMFNSDDPPTAIFSAQNLITLELIHTLREIGASKSCALIGFDDLPLADLIEPAISLVTQDIPAMGREAAEMLFSRLDGNIESFHTKVVETTFTQRASGLIRPKK